MRLWKLAFAVAIVFCLQKRSHAKPPQLWLYYATNLIVDANIDKADQIWTRAAKAGYTHVLLADSKFSRLASLPQHYFDNCRKIRSVAQRLKLQIVPAVFPIGYSNELLSIDPNLAEGLPVRDQPFVVEHGVARLDVAASPRLEKTAWHDDRVSLDGDVATVHAGPGNARVTYKITTPPFRAYHISVEIRTVEFSGGEAAIKALAGDASLQWQNIHVKPTQDWTRYDVVFDSLDHSTVNLYFGIWGQTTGQLQWRHPAIEEEALVNVLRRSGAPCVVARQDTGKQLKEGVDYDAIIDPKMGNSPYAGEYDGWHEPPVIHTHLPEGTRLKISWFYPPIVYDGQVAICISEPKTTELLADQARRMKALWNAPLYMMSHDEFRVAGWDDACLNRHLTPGQMLAKNIEQCTELLKPAQAAVWSDMFDPNHNAVKGPYYLVNGPWLDSWQGLSKDVLIVNWNHGKRDASLKFFADRGNEQLLAGYYDADLSGLSDWMKSAAGVKGVVGYMYTTWRSDYGVIEAFAEDVKAEAR